LSQPSDLRQPGERSEWLLYTAFCLTGGLFAFVWIVLWMSDINRIERRKIFPVTTIATALSIGCIVYVTALFSLGTLTSIASSLGALRLPILIVLAIVLTASLFGFPILILRKAKRGMGETSGARDALAVIGLTVLSGVSFILVQQRMNALFRHRAVRGQ
jgi:hypothetical protein